MHKDNSGSEERAHPWAIVKLDFRKKHLLAHSTGCEIRGSIQIQPVIMLLPREWSYFPIIENNGISSWPIAKVTLKLIFGDVGMKTLIYTKQWD